MPIQILNLTVAGTFYTNSGRLQVILIWWEKIAKTEDHELESEIKLAPIVLAFWQKFVNMTVSKIHNLAIFHV